MFLSLLDTVGKTINLLRKWSIKVNNWMVPSLKLMGFLPSYPRLSLFKGWWTRQGDLLNDFNPYTCKLFLHAYTVLFTGIIMIPVPSERK